MGRLSIGWNYSPVGFGERWGASEVSLAWGLCESLCLCLTHPSSLKAALVCWCLRSCHTQGPGSGEGGVVKGRARPWFPGSWTQRAFSLPVRPTSPTPPSSALLIAMAPALPHASMKILLDFLWDFSNLELMA